MEACPNGSLQYCEPHSLPCLSSLPCPRPSESLHLACARPSPTSMAMREHQLWASGGPGWVGTVRFCVQEESYMMVQTHTPFSRPCLQTCESYVYDFSEMYPGILTNPNFIIPTKAGKEMTLKRLPDVLSTGYYRVKISCENKAFKKLFSFSQDHTYTNVSLNYAQALQKEYDVKINLIQDDKPNAYIYESITKGSSIFSYWFYKMLALKKSIS
jgi:hypothetical protein